MQRYLVLAAAIALGVFLSAPASNAVSLVTTSTGAAADGESSAVMLIVGRTTSSISVPATSLAVSLGTANTTVSLDSNVTGSQLNSGDQINCSLASGATLTTNAMVAVSATATNQVTFRFSTPIALGVTVAPALYNCSWME